MSVETALPICPHCSHEDRDWCDHLSQEDLYDGSRWPHMCPDCGDNYIITLHVSMGFSTEEVKPPI